MQKYAKSILSVAALTFSYAGQAQKMDALVIDAPALYAEYCAKCHGKNGRAKTFSGLLTFSQDLTNAAWQEKMLDADIFDALVKGRRMMPAYADKLSALELQALVEVVRDFKR
jgi:mono/diheme cytochrome c family protein